MPATATTATARDQAVGPDSAAGVLRPRPASLRVGYFQLLSEAATHVLTAWERVHEADAVRSRLCLGAERDDAGLSYEHDIGFEDDVAQLASLVARLEATVVRPTLRDAEAALAAERMRQPI